MSPRPPLVVLAAGLLCLSAAGPLPAQMWSAKLQPQSHASPSGEYVLHVDPTDPRGAGPGRHTLDRIEDGKARRVWAKTLPFTLWHAAVTDAGIAVGYGYTGGQQG